MVDAVISDRFENVITKGRTLHEEHAATGKTDVKNEPFTAWRTQSLTLLQVVYGTDHPYARNFAAETDVRQHKLIYARSFHVEGGIGVLEAAAEDYRSGHTWTFRERVHADVFDDFLEMAVSLLKDGYVTAAAVIAGTTLEEHLRKLCQKHGVAISKKTSVMNDDLLKQSVYLQAEWRQIQGWFDIRNDCAHNPTTIYDKKLIEAMINGIREFSVRHPA